jgi:MerR family transcriptional regulator, heat shock protein HspR
VKRRRDRHVEVSGWTHEEEVAVNGTPDRRDERTEERAVYIISVAAELAGVHPQTLRMYERRGLLAPKRTSGNTRRYSERDIARIQMIQQLTQRDGVSLAGVKLFIEMREQLALMRRRTEELERELLDQMRRRRSGAEIVPLRSLLALPWDETAP